MKPEDILLALGEIDETLPAECVQPVKKKPNPWKGVIVAAACIAVVLISVVTVKKINLSPMTALPTESENATETFNGTVTEEYGRTTVEEAMTEETGMPVPESHNCATMGHLWKAATCNAPKTCAACGLTEGDKLQHSFKAATCTSPECCRYCGATKGSALGHEYDDSGKCTRCGAYETASKKGSAACNHQWIEADCTTPRTCSICGATTGSPNKHNYAAATCDKPQTCRNCGATTGSSLGHDYAANGYCKRCHLNRLGEKDPSYVPYAKPSTTTTTAKPSETETTTTTTGVTVTSTTQGDDVTLPPVPTDGESSTLHTSATQADWYNKPVRDKYPNMLYNGKTYSYNGSADQQDAGQSLGTCTLQGSDGKSEHAVTVNLYALPDVSPETEVLVRFPDGSYYRYK